MELAEFYPTAPDGSRAITYLWARTIICDSCGAEIPLVRSFWLSDKGKRKRALRYRVEKTVSSKQVGSLILTTETEKIMKSSGTLYWTGVGSDALSESDLSGNFNEEYVFFDGMRVSRIDRPSDTVHSFIVDHLGSSRMMVVASGTNSLTTEQDVDYTPYGIVAYGTASDPYQFTSKERDSESMLDNFGARHYASSIGRFMVPDPAGRAAQDPMNPQSWNLYAYVLNNPLSAIDPLGLDCVYVRSTGDVQKGDADAGASPLEWSPPDSQGNSYAVKEGDCASQNDSGFYFDGKVNASSLGLNPNGDVVGQVDSGSGPNTQCSGDCPNIGSGLPPSATAFGGVGELPTQAVTIFGMVAAETYQFNKQMNCAAAAVYPFLPGPKPEDLTTLAGEETADAASHAFESKSEAAAKLAAKFARAKKKGTAQMARITKQESKMLKDLSHVAEGVGYVFMVHEAYNNFRECEGER
jgi:RHS repeat-associated protein